MSAPVSQYQIALLSRAKARVAKSRVQYGDEVAYPPDMELVLDLIGQVESLTSALELAYAIPSHDHLTAASVRTTGEDQ